MRSDIKMNLVKPTAFFSKFGQTNNAIIPIIDFVAASSPNFFRYISR
jgi:hypothetical protein